MVIQSTLSHMNQMGTKQDEINHLNSLLKQFNDAIASGNTDSINMLLTDFLTHFTHLQKVASPDSQKIIQSLIGNIYTLQVSDWIYFV